jgi:ketosteroid isomerase-like protein
MVRTAASTPGSLVSLGVMPEQNPDVAFVLEAFRAFEVQAGTLEEYYERFWVPDGVIELVDGFPVTGSYRGLEGYKRWFADSYGPYEDVRRRLDSISKEGERVVALLTVTGRPKDEDLELEVQLGNTYALEDGRIKRLNVYVGHERAIEAARNGG